MWLVNLDKIYKGQKYILRIAPSSTTIQGGSDDIDVKKINDTSDLWSRKIDSVDNAIATRLDISMKGTTYRQKEQTEAIETMLARLRDIDCKILKKRHVSE